MLIINFFSFLSLLFLACSKSIQEGVSETTDWPEFAKLGRSNQLIVVDFIKLFCGNLDCPKIEKLKAVCSVDLIGKYV